ncbi:MAG: DUF6573 family protein [Pirellulaceae bacterium]
MIKGCGQSIDARSWDVLYSSRYATSLGGADSDRVDFKVLVLNADGIRKVVNLWSLIGPGDEGELVITICCKARIERMAPNIIAPTIKVTVKQERAFKFLWLKYVRGFNPTHHCARCLNGNYSTLFPYSSGHVPPQTIDGVLDLNQAFAETGFGDDFGFCGCAA